MSEPITYLLVDGENLDATLGMSILGRRPKPEERPRWQRLLSFIEDAWDQPVRGLFFLAVDGDIPFSFVQALRQLGYQPILLRGEGKVVDIGIQRTAQALLERGGDVVLASQDADFAEDFSALAQTDRRVGVVGFEEFMSQELRTIPGITLWDLEHDVSAFDTMLPRLQVIDVADFDPFQFL